MLRPARVLRDFVMERVAGATPEAQASQPPSRPTFMWRGQAALMGSDIGLLARGL